MSKNLDLVGKRVTITGDHPWKGMVGLVKSFGPFGITGRHGFNLRLDNGTGCVVWCRNELQERK